MKVRLYSMFCDNIIGIYLFFLVNIAHRYYLWVGNNFLFSLKSLHFLSLILQSYYICRLQNKTSLI